MPEAVFWPIFYCAVAFLGCWAIDLIVIVARVSAWIDPVAKLIVVAICLVFLLFRAGRAAWAW